MTTQVKMVTRRRRRVTRRPILPPISSDGIRKEIQDSTTNRPRGHKCQTTIMKRRKRFGRVKMLSSSFG